MARFRASTRPKWPRSSARNRSSFGVAATTCSLPRSRVPTRATPGTTRATPVSLNPSCRSPNALKTPWSVSCPIGATRSRRRCARASGSSLSRTATASVPSSSIWTASATRKSSDSTCPPVGRSSTSSTQASNRCAAIILADRRAAAQRDLDTLLRRGQALETEIASRREGLGRLLTLRYLNGEQSALKLLFSGEEPGRIARELHYYGYVSRALAEFIGELRSSLARLKDLEARTRERNVEIFQ